MLEYWFMFPVALLFSTVAMATGIGGAAMFTPFFLLVLKLPASLAVGVGLFIEVFGFGSGLIGFARKKLIQYDVGLFIACLTVPAAVGGAFLSTLVPDVVVKLVLVLVLLVLGFVLWKPENKLMLKKHDKHQKCDHEETEDCFEEPDQIMDVCTLSLLGGALAGMVSTGVGEINDYTLLKRYEMHGPVAAGTSVFIVALTVLAGSLSHAFDFFARHAGELSQVLGILVFTVPGVLIGGQLGVKASEMIPEEKRDTVIGSLFFVLALAALLTVL